MPPASPSPALRARPNLLLPEVLLPPKKRLAWRARPKTTTIPVPAPLPVAAVAHITATPAAAAADIVAFPAPILAPQADAVGSRSSSPSTDEKPPVPMPPPARKVRKVVKKLVRKIVRKVPKGTSAARRQAANAAAAASSAAGASQSQLEDEEEEELEPGEIPPEKKPAADCNAAGPVSEEERDRAPVAAGMAADEREERMAREVYVGRLDKDATEEDVRAALAEAGEITQVRILMNGVTKKNRGYGFVRYREAAQAKKAIQEFGDVKICGKQCRIAAVQGNGEIKIDQRDLAEDYNTVYYGERIPFSPSLWCIITPFYCWISPINLHGSSWYLPADFNYGLLEPWERNQMRQVGSRKPK